MSDRPKKRVRISESSEKERRVLSFLDVEAGEAVEGNGEEDEDQDDLDGFLDALDDEIDVEEWHETTRTVSLAIESQTSDNSEDWGSFLSRAHKRAQESASSRVNEDATSPSLLIQTAHDVLASASWIPKKTDLSGFLWRVPVRVGYEEATTFTLFNKQVKGGTAFPGIYSITGRRDQPGAIYIEAPRHKDVVKLCENVSDLFIRGMTPIPPADARLCLHTPLTLDPKPKSWAHVTKSWLYKGDLAYVLDYDVETGADVLVVPRVDILQRLSRSRPPQALLKLDDIYRELGQKAVEVKGDSFIFRSLSYHISGYHQFKTRNLSVSSISTMAELSTFRDYPHMSLHAVLDMYAKLEELRLERDDPVKVVQGQLKGSVGVIRSLDEDRSLATIVVQDTVGEVVLPTQYLRKHLSVGDQVGVVDGIHKGSVGWVTALLEKNLVIWDDRAQQELTVAPNCVAFHWNPQTLATIPPPTSSIELPSKLVQDPLYFLTGNQVTIVGSHVYKGYDGYIKNTLHNGSVVVETEAGLRDVVVDLHNVSKRDSSTLSPLSRNELLQSQLPLSVSTPLPTGTSVSPSSAWRHPSSNLNSVAGMTLMPDVAASDTTSPAWDPSSRTPLPISETITHPWMYSHKSDLKVLFELTRKDAPSSPTLIWRWGDFSRPKMLKVQNGDMEEEILESLVTYVLPSKEKDRVFITEFTHPRYCDGPFKVANWGPKECRLVPCVKEKGKPPPSFYCITDWLALIR